MTTDDGDTDEHGSTNVQIGLQRVVEGEFAPTDFATAPDDHRKYIVDQPGRVLVLENGGFRDEPFLDIRDRVLDLEWGHDERGLLGLAFHPDYEQNRRLYVRYSSPRRDGTPEDWDHTEVLAEFEADADGERVNPVTERTVMEIPHPHLHHNAGDLAFGPEGHLYFGMGDGGHTGDVGPGHVEGGNGQDVTENLLGSVIRIDIDDDPTEHPRTDKNAPDQPEDDEGYGLPGDNPWLGGDGRDEMVSEVNEDVWSDAESIRRGLESSSQHELFAGEGRFVDDRALEMVDGEDAGAELRAETVLIAAGTRPAIPPIDGIEDVGYLTSREALQLEEPPDHLVVVGGGYIAAELGHFFGTFGSEVTIVGRRPHLLPAADDEVAAAFTERFADRFMIHTSHEVTAVREDGDGVTVEAHPYEYGPEGGLVEGSEPVTATGDRLLVAAGRTPNTDLLDLAATSVETDARGFVETDEYLRTSADDVWALGDIVGEYLLKHNANHEARTVARNLFADELEPIDYSAMPFAVFASPEVAGVGATEGQLRAADREYATNTHRFEETGRGDAMHAEGFVKVLVDLKGEILGCHIIGPDASTLIQEVVVAMKAGSGTVQDIREAIHVHPALPEVVQRAFSGQFSRGGSHDHDHGHNH